MTLKSYIRSIDGFVHRCGICSKRVSIREGTFFAMSHLSLTQILYICNYWVLKQPVRAAAAETENSLVSTVQWYQYCRDIESWKIEKITSLLGGEDVIMHLDETVMLKKKYNRGRQRANNIWVIGLYDTSLRKGFVERIGDRKATTLIPIITRPIKRGSIIHTDEWKGYNSPSSLGYSHHRVNHSNDFVDPVAGTHTNSIEGFWGRLKNLGKVEITEEGIKLLGKLTKSLNSANTTNGGCPIAESPMKENISTPHDGKSNTSKKRKRVATPSPERVKQPSRTSLKGTKHNCEGDEHSSQSGITVGTSSSVHIPPFHTEQPITSVKQPTSVRFLDAFEYGEEWLPGLLKPTNLKNFISCLWPINFTN
ncbi:unnamed protein product [Trichobilharzia szidati]|nr:unnamed protein product [Trichobilharzia szidati]